MKDARSRWGRRSARGGVVAVVLACVAHATSATTLVDDFRDALAHDAVFAVSLAEADAQRLQARLARTAYYPEARLSISQLDSDAAGRQTVSITQPLLNLDRWLALKEADPREAAAAARIEQSRSDLALRLFRALAGLIEARERLRLNASAASALEVQVQAARQGFDLGQGTVTDVRDAELRLAQARAQAFVLQAAVRSAQREYESIVGRPVPGGAYALRATTPAFELPPLPDLASRAMIHNPTVRAADVSLQLAEIAARRARAALLPSVAAVAQRSQSNGNTVSSSAIALRMEVPLNAGTVLRNQSAELEVRRMQEALRDARQKVGLEVERLHAQLSAAQAELPVRQEALRAAELSVEANERSFDGGVRTRLDVLNALQARFQSQADLVSAQLRLGDAMLALQVISAGDLPAALADVQSQVFGR